ncbi:MAG: hypothetical protein WBA97_30505 [Actinophytocola sp.]|uniref:hypothetical protein n=1 Tax=Actinophytocola sp. TaxID=1872138 RepID=UPI003C751A0A
MKPHSRRLTIGVVVAGMALATASAAHAEPPAKERPATTVTLVTGDEVVLRDGRPQQVRPGPGRDGIGFTVQRAGSHVTVIPEDVMAAVTQGRVDRRLFDLTTLTDFGYDRTGTVP